MAVIESDRWLERLRRRRGVLVWRLRYWWMDTEDGAHAHAVAFCLAILTLLMQIARMSVRALQPSAPEPQTAVVWWVVQLIIAVVAAIVSYALRPKLPKTAATKQSDGPTVEDGLCVDDHFGEVWVEPQILAWKVVRTQKIKSKTGGKK